MLLLQKHIALIIQKLVLLLTPSRYKQPCNGVFRFSDTRVCQKSNGVRDPRCQATSVKNIPVGARLLRSPLPWDPSTFPAKRPGLSHAARTSASVVSDRLPPRYSALPTASPRRTAGGSTLRWTSSTDGQKINADRSKLTLRNWIQKSRT